MYRGIFDNKIIMAIVDNYLFFFFLINMRISIR
jgi:hypothetical protein